MYIPSQYREDDPAYLVRFMKRHSFATLVSVAEGSPLATHLPLSVAVQGEEVVLRGHFARANPQWQSAEAGVSLAIFSGPHAYVSPAHYDKRESVPTWNYLAVHAYGRVRLVEDEGETESLLYELIEQHEAEYRSQWDGLSERYRKGMMQGIVGFELRVERLEGAAKLSQNKSREEQARIYTALSASDDPAARETGAEMQRRLEDV